MFFFNSVFFIVCLEAVAAANDGTEARAEQPSADVNDGASAADTNIDDGGEDLRVEMECGRANDMKRQCDEPDELAIAADSDGESDASLQVALMGARISTPTGADNGEKRGGEELNEPAGKRARTLSPSTSAGEAAPKGEGKESAEASVADKTTADECYEDNLLSFSDDCATVLSSKSTKDLDGEESTHDGDGERLDKMFPAFNLPEDMHEHNEQIELAQEDICPSMVSQLFLGSPEGAIDFDPLESELLFPVIGKTLDRLPIGAGMVSSTDDLGTLLGQLRLLAQAHEGELGDAVVQKDFRHCVSAASIVGEMINSPNEARKMMIICGLVDTFTFRLSEAGAKWAAREILRLKDAVAITKVLCDIDGIERERDLTEYNNKIIRTKGQLRRLTHLGMADGSFNERGERLGRRIMDNARFGESSSSGSGRNSRNSDNGQRRRQGSEQRGQRRGF